MNDLTLICERCHFPIGGDSGCIYVTFGAINAAQAIKRLEDAGEAAGMLEPVLWRTRHYGCRPDTSADFYGITSDRIATWKQLIWWTAHLMEKNWFPLSDWDDLLRELGGDETPRRIREAA